MFRWRWPRLVGGLQGIRLRLAGALAVALAPILVLSVFQSRQAYDDEMNAVRVQLAHAAESSAADAQARIDSAVIMLETLNQENLGLSCVERLRQVVDQTAAYGALARISRGGRILCSSSGAEGAGAITSQPWFQSLRSGEDTVLVAAPPGFMVHEPALLAAVRTEREGVFDGAMLAIIPMEQLRPRFTGRTAPEGSEVALVAPTGEVLTATQLRAFPARLDQMELEPRLVGFRDQDHERRVMTAEPLAGRRVHVVLSAPAQGMFGWAMGNALGVFVMPLLTWIAAFICVLVVTERVVVRWLAYLERVAAIHARGRYGVRPIHAQRAPGEIRNLAAAMDDMVRAISSRDASLRETLEEKDALMREIHHRVKNNLQVITSLLNMQQRALKDPAARAAMNDTRQRITALALIYRALYQSENLKRVDVGRFLQDLVGQLVASDVSSGPAVQSHVEADTLVVDPDRLAPLALWAVEAVTNAQKHAFEGRGGRLQVRFRAGEEHSVLEVEDDGPGDPEGLGQGGVGRTLMTAFARQLRGQAEIVAAPGGGLIARLTFPTPEVSMADSPARSRNHSPS